MALRKNPIVIGVLTAAVVSGGTAYAMTRPAQPTAPHSDVVASVADVTAGSPPVYLEADLSGRNEQTAHSAMGDPRGTAVELLRIKGNQITFEITWQNLGAPTAARIHTGTAGQSGSAVIPMMTAPMSDTLTAVAGSVTVNNAGLLARLIGNPSQYYLDMGNAKYPSGAVRGQFRRIAPVDFQRILHVGPFAALNSGDQVVASTGDNDARATAFLGFGSTSINYAVSWSALTAPTSFTLNQGAVGMNGGRTATLFLAPHGLTPAITEVAGAVQNVPAKTVAAMKANPAMFYTNLTTAKFPFGAARGQLFMTPPSTPTTMPTTMPTMPPPTTMPTTTAPMKPTTTMPTQPTQPSQPVMTSPSTPAPPHW